MNSMYSEHEKAGLGINVRKIADYLVSRTSNGNDQSLMYGNMGIAIFLLHWWKECGVNKYYENASKLIVGVFDYLNIQIHIHRNNQNAVDLSFRSGLGGIAWGICNLVHEGFIDCELDETMCLIDAAIFRQMVDGAYSKKPNEVINALEISLYVRSRNSRLAKEYYKRFVKEWNIVFNRDPEYDTNLKGLVCNIEAKYDRDKITDPNSDITRWYTTSRGVYSLHLGLQDGLSGLGLAILLSQ